MLRVPQLHPLYLFLAAVVDAVHAAPHNIPLQKRGGSDNPYTDDPNAAPTSPPTSHYQNGVPTIQGSEGGFIGLIIGLGLFVIASCVAVFFLLKRRRARAADTARRRSGPSRSLGGAHDTKADFPSSGRFFGRSSKKGWVQTTDGPGDEGGIELSGARDSSKRTQGPYLASNASGAFSSASTIRLAPPEQYSDPFSPTPSTDDLALSPGNAVTPGAAVEGGEYQQVKGGQTETTSPTSFTSGSFEGGTRFRESF